MMLQVNMDACLVTGGSFYYTSLLRKLNVWKSLDVEERFANCKEKVLPVQILHYEIVQDIWWMVSYNQFDFQFFAHWILGAFAVVAFSDTKSHVLVRFLCILYTEICVNVTPGLSVIVVMFQVVELLHVGSAGVGRQFLRVAVSTIQQMLQRYPELSWKLVLKPVIEPLDKTIRSQGCFLSFLWMNEPFVNNVLEIHNMQWLSQGIGYSCSIPTIGL